MYFAQKIAIIRTTIFKRRNALWTFHSAYLKTSHHKTFCKIIGKKRPLLIRNGLPQIVDLFEPNDILELALEEEITARLIQCQNEQWSVKNSPFEESDLENLPMSNGR